MRYYEVLVAHGSYHGQEALTYSWAEPLAAGRLVRVTLRNRAVLGIVVREVTEPSFNTKPMAAVMPLPPLPAASLALLDWLREYYPAPLGAIVRLFVPPTLAERRTQNAEAGGPLPSSFSVLPSTPAPPLTAEQKQAISAMHSPGSFLLHGITGSGKSRVYVELAQHAIDSGKSALVLTPEIGLTAQLTQTFTATFEHKVFVLHSQQTAAQRRDIWYQLLVSAEPVVVIGPRSALFAPLHTIGLIVLDEAHDGAYKNESAPHYQANRVAAKLAQLHQAIFVSGSATPSVEDYYIAEQKQRPILGMHGLAKTESRTSNAQVLGHASEASTLRNSATVVVDMKNAANFTRSRLFSTPLLDAVSTALTAGEQSLLYLNRRGTANVVLCSSCGWQTLCPNCDLTLTYHGDEHRLRCHICGYNEVLPTNCPVCGNAEILFKSIGTKAAYDAVQKLFPGATVQRFDTDLKKSERLEQHLSDLQSGSADIIVGTQMVGKGLDLPKLSVVGILNADSSLLIPDYTAAERTYQLLSQVAGRVGRGHRAGTVVAQTYDPENPTLLAALSGDWAGFYASELAERQRYRFPPFVYLLKLGVLRATSASAEKAANDLSATLGRHYPGLVIEGPSPSFHPRERGKYSWQLLVKASRRPVLTRIIAELPSGWNYDIDPTNML